MLLNYIILEEFHGDNVVVSGQSFHYHDLMVIPTKVLKLLWQNDDFIFYTIHIFAP